MSDNDPVGEPFASFLRKIDPQDRAGNFSGGNLFEQAADMARMQAAGYAAVRERARNEALEEALACYSPDDSAADWADKIRALKTMKEGG